MKLQSRARHRLFFNSFYGQRRRTTGWDDFGRAPGVISRRAFQSARPRSYAGKSHTAGVISTMPPSNFVRRRSLRAIVSDTDIGQRVRRGARPLFTIWRDVLAPAAARRLEGRNARNVDERRRLDAVKVIGLLVSEDVMSDVWKQMAKRFWALYWSELSVVESPAVDSMMYSIGEVVKRIEETGDAALKVQLQPLAVNLSRMIRAEIEVAWRGTTTPQT